VQVKLKEMKLRRSRAFGDCWLACLLWQQLGLDRFWQQCLRQGREGLAWAQVPELLAVNRLIDPGSQFRLHRQGLDRSAMDQLLGLDFAGAEKDRLYRCLDRILRDGRFDGKPLIGALVITPQGFPLAYEVPDGNTSDRSTLRGFLEKIEAAYGKARRTQRAPRMRDRGIPTEELLAKSAGRRAKETAIRRRKLAGLLWKLRGLRRSGPLRDQLLI
jgi:hypothetical protein